MNDTESRRVYIALAKERAAELAVHGVGLAGVAAVVEGVRQMYPPAALVVGGFLALAWTVLKVRNS